MSNRWFILCFLLIQIFLLLSPIFPVHADELPYKQPQYVPYLPNIKPYIPKGVEIEAQQPKQAVKKQESPPFDWLTWGNGGIYTQVAWNVVGDVIPATLGRDYVRNNRLLKVIKANNRNDVRIVGTKNTPYWLTRYTWLKSGEHTIWKFDLGKWTYENILVGYDKRLRSYGFQDLKQGKRYTREQFNKSLYSQYDKKFNGQMSLRQLLKSTSVEGLNTFKESILIFSSSARQVAWWKLTGVVGMVFSGFVTTMDYLVGSNKDAGIISAKYLAALPVDFAVGSTVGIASSVITAGIASAFAFAFNMTIPAIIVIGATLLLGFGFAMVVGNNKKIKAKVDIVHGALTWVMSRSFRMMSYPSKMVTKGTYNIMEKMKKITNGITKIFNK